MQSLAESVLSGEWNSNKQSSMTMLFPLWFLALPGLSAGVIGAAQVLRRVQIPCSWAALDVPSPAHIQHIQHMDRSVSSAHPQTCLGWPEQPQQLSRTDLTGMLNGAWDCDILHVTVGTFVCVYSRQLTAPEHRSRAWGMADPSAHLYRLPGCAQTWTAAGRARHWHWCLTCRWVGEDTWLWEKEISLVLYLLKTPPVAVYVHEYSKTLLHDVWNTGLILVFRVWFIH